MDGNEMLKNCILILLLLPAILFAEEGKSLSGLNIQEFEERAESADVWKNNPFVVPAADVAVSDLKLVGIVYSEKDSAAVINDTVAKVGDKIGTNEVVAIEKLRVIVRNENGLFSLSLGGGVK